MARQPFILAGVLLLSAVGTAQKDNGGECDCFVTNGSTKAYFSYHRFFDYRNVPHSLTSDPTVLTDPSDASEAKNSSAFFSSPSWTADWTVPNWDNSNSLNTSDSDATILMINSPSNVYIKSSTDNSPAYNTYLTLRTTRTEGFQSAGEIDSKALNYRYLSARFLARTVGDTGGCAGIFTYRCPTESCTTSSSNVEEADIEILTRDPRNRIQLTNQPSESASGQSLSQATLNGTLPGGVEWSAWNEYRYDWLPGLSSWYVNGVSVGSISFQAPKNPAGLILNMWSNGGSWTGNMSIGAAAYLQIQWIEIVYNTSGPIMGSKMVRDGLGQVLETSNSQVSDQIGAFGDISPYSIPIQDHERVASRADSSTGCRTVCSVDENVAYVGTPVVSKAVHDVNRQVTYRLIAVPVLLGFWFMG